MLNISPFPWTRDEYGSIRDAAGARVNLTDVGLSTGRGRLEPDHTCHGNTALLLAAPALLEFWRAYKAAEDAADRRDSPKYLAAVGRFDIAVLAAYEAVRALEE